MVLLCQRGRRIPRRAGAPRVMAKATGIRSFSESSCSRSRLRVRPAQGVPGSLGQSDVVLRRNGFVVLVIDDTSSIEERDHRVVIVNGQ